jgi:predicted nucleic acid-binding protein
MSAEAPLVVVDASVVVKWFIAADETGVAEAAVLLADHAADRIRLVAPALVAHELMGVLVRRLRDESVAEALDAFFDAGVHLVAPDRELMGLAATLVQERQLSTFDSAYAALASSLGCPLATADRRLANALDGAVEVLAV